MSSTGAVLFRFFSRKMCLSSHLFVWSKNTPVFVVECQFHLFQYCLSKRLLLPGALGYILTLQNANNMNKNLEGIFKFSYLSFSLCVCIILCLMNSEWITHLFFFSAFLIHIRNPETEKKCASCSN